MSVLQLYKIEQLDTKCNDILNEDDKIRFAGVINNLGNLIAGGFKEGVTPLVDDKMTKMLYMQLVLEISMRRDFDDTLGCVNYIAANRNNAVMITIPFNRHVVLISAESTASIEKIVTRVITVFKKIILEEEKLQNR
ncbi:MAG: hypothetical protein HW410_813 [Nitrosarchaeum sp.]|jgi:hypothetical protein|nr:hypothetical protein [Nitrosarchaeum sp.]